jgi:aminoglycoside phosphotransferase (APT) family kinase protein
VGPPVWTADIDIDTALASRLIAGAFPQLGAQVVEPFGSGWDNAAFLVDGRVVFRFPRRRAVANLIEREIALLPLVASRLPLAISVPIYIGAASLAYPWTFAGYECIDGTTACALVLDDRMRHSLAVPLAHVPIGTF